MVQSPSWEANWFAASQEIPRILWNPKVHYGTHKRPPPVPILCQPIQSTHPHPTSRRSILILSTHLRLGLPSGLFPSGFPTKTLYAFTQLRKKNHILTTTTKATKTTKNLRFPPEIIFDLLADHAIHHLTQLCYSTVSVSCPILLSAAKRFSV